MSSLALAGGDASEMVSGAAPQAGKDTPRAVDLALRVDVIELRHRLSPYQGAQVNSGHRHLSWFLIHVRNSSDLPASRILLAGEEHGRNVRLLPYQGRPAIRQVKGATPNLLVSRVKAYGAHAYRVRLPPHSRADVAVALSHAAPAPSLMAWREPALAAHSRWMAVYATTVAVLIAAAACIACGLALLKHQPVLSWGAGLMFSLLLMQLARSGVFDAMLSTPFGGPFGVEALFTGTSLACAAMMLNRIMPFGDIFRWMRKSGRYLLFGILALSFLAYVGVPVAGVLLDVCAVAGVLLLAAYVMYGWSLGLPLARGLAPSAVLFAFAALLSAATALGVLGADALTPDMSGAFLAAAVIVSVLSMVADRRKVDDIPEPAFVAAREAIDAARQGVFVCDFARNMVFLSPAAAALFGWSNSRRKFRLEDWLQRLEPECRAGFSQGLEMARRSPGKFFRLEFQAKTYSGEVLWFELRANARCDGPEGENCVGMLADITPRKQTEAAARDEGQRDPLTGAGNRMALIARLEALGSRISAGALLLFDIDEFRALRVRLGDDGCDRLLVQMYERLHTRLPEAWIFRTGGDCFAAWLADAPEDPARLAEELLQLNSVPYKLGERSEMAPFSIGLAGGQGDCDPLQLICRADVALGKARSGAAACLYSPAMKLLPAGEDPDALLLRALEAGEVKVVYTPVIRLLDKTVAGFCASARWSFAGQWLNPCEMAAFSGDSVLIQKLQRLLTRQSAARLREWQQYFPLSEPLFVVVPVVGLPDGAGATDRFLADEVIPAADFPAGSLKFSLTHQHIAASGMVRRLQALAQAGAGFVLSGYAGRKSEAEILGRQSFDLVVTDAGLVNPVWLRREGGGRISDLQSMVHAGGGCVLASGVASAGVAAELPDLGVGLATGPFCSMPLEDEAALKFIAAHFRSADSEMAV